MAKKKRRTKSGSTGRKIIIAALIVLIVIAGYFAYQKYNAPDPAGISAKLQNSSELTTQKMIYTGIIEESSGSIPLINKDKYLIKFKATISAGFNLTDVKSSDIKVTDDTVTVRVPHAKVIDVKIDPNDVEFEDTNLSLIRATKNQTVEAVKKAQANAENYAKSNNSGLLTAADDNSANIIKGLLSSEAHGRKIVVKYK